MQTLDRTTPAGNVSGSYDPAYEAVAEAFVENFETRDEVGASLIIRGLRAVSDFEYEFQLATMNKHLNPKVDTVFLTAAENHQFIASSLVKEIASLGGDVEDFVPEVVLKALKIRYPV